jgi:DNA polymerase-4
MIVFPLARLVEAKVATASARLATLPIFVRMRPLQRNQVRGRTITLKIKYADFRQITRSRSLATATDTAATICDTAVELLTNSGLEDKKIRLLGISISNFDPPPGNDTSPSSNGTKGQLELF